MLTGREILKGDNCALIFKRIFLKLNLDQLSVPLSRKKLPGTCMQAEKNPGELAELGLGPELPGAPPAFYVPSAGFARVCVGVGWGRCIEGGTGV